MNIRDATEDDLPQILVIYNDVVANTTAIYDAGPSTLEHHRAWFGDRRRRGMPVLVAESEGEVVVMVAYIDSQATASLRMHEKLGFERVGVVREVGRMRDRWLDVVVMQRLI